MARLERGIARAVAFTLTDSAKFAKDDLIQSLKNKVDKPAPFTLRPSGYRVVIARFGDANPSSEMNIDPVHSAYEQFLFSGGARPAASRPGQGSLRARAAGLGSEVHGALESRRRLTVSRCHHWARHVRRAEQAARSREGRPALAVPGIWKFVARTRFPIVILKFELEGSPDVTIEVLASMWSTYMVPVK